MVHFFKLNHTYYLKESANLQNIYIFSIQYFFYVKQLDRSKFHYAIGQLVSKFT